MGHLFLLLIALLLTSTHAKAAITEEKGVGSMMRAMVGSRPPSCEGRCRSCGRCEAVQVPITPQEQLHKKRKKKKKKRSVEGSSNGGSATVVPSSYDEHSNYKPLSWRCKCGGLLLNP